MDALAAMLNIKQILDLNDDCLREIFEILALSDLCAISDVCTRFRCIAQEHFRHSYGEKLELHQINRDSDTDWQNLKRLSQFLRNFGGFITSIDGNRYCPYHYNNGRFGNRIPELVACYCSETLTELRLRGLGFSSHTFAFARSISKLKQLKILQLATIWIDLEVLMEIIKNLTELTELYLNHIPIKLNTEKLLELIRNTPKLEFFQYNQRKRKPTWVTVDTYQNVLEIVKRHRVRTHLKIEMLKMLRVNDHNGISDARQTEGILTFVQPPGHLLENGDTNRTPRY